VPHRTYLWLWLILEEIEGTHSDAEEPFLGVIAQLLNTVEYAWIKLLVRASFERLAVLNSVGGADMYSYVKTRFQESREANVFGPAMVAEAFLPLLLKSPHPYSLHRQ
jgi:hypothetical protein